MGIIAKYKFNQNTYENFLPRFNTGFTDYVYTDEIDTDGYTIRTIGNDSGDLPTLMRFGTSSSTSTNKERSLLKILECNTDNITNMNSMFKNCANLTFINFLNFNTQNVTDMLGMFQGCSSLTSLDLSNFNTNQVTLLSSMFRDCSNLTSLNLSSFNTQNVTNMTGMFYNCSNLTSLDLSSFNTQNTTNMSNMFYSCTKLTELDLSSFNTQKVANTTSIFYGWTSEQKVYISSRWTLGTGFKPTFIIKSIYTIAKYKFDQNTYESFIPTFNTDFTDYIYSDEIDTDAYTIRTIGNDSGDLPTSIRFGSSSGGLTDTQANSLLSVEYINTSDVTDMSNMFNNCSKLASLDVSNFNTSNVTDMNSMFRGCSSLTLLDLSNFNTSNVKNMGSMFYKCSSLTSLDLSSFNTSNVTNTTNIFANTSKLTNIGLLYALASTINSLSSNMGTDIARIIWYQDADATELNSVTNIETKLYKTNILTVNEDVTLRSNGDVYDELNLLTGRLTQRIDENNEVLAQAVVKTVDLTVVDQDNQPTQLGTFENLTYVSLEAENLIPEVEMEVATIISEELASTSPLMDDISNDQQQLEVTVDEQSDNVDATMIAVTEIYEETL